MSPTDEYIWTAHVLLAQGATKAEQNLIVDTGANRTTVSAATARQLGLKADGSGPATLFLGKKLTVDYGHVAQMQIGDLALPNQTVYYSEQSLSEYPVSLGMDILRGYTVLLDFGGKMMYFGTLTAVPGKP